MSLKLYTKSHSAITNCDFLINTTIDFALLLRYLWVDNCEVVETISSDSLLDLTEKK